MKSAVLGSNKGIFLDPLEVSSRRSLVIDSFKTVPRGVRCNSMVLLPIQCLTPLSLECRVWVLFAYETQCGFFSSWGCFK